MNNKDFTKPMLIGLVVAAVAVVGYFVLRSSPELLTAAPSIANISPFSGPVGTALAITGSGFTPTKNSLHFGDGFAYINDLDSRDGKTLELVLPETFDTCHPSGEPCTEFLNNVLPGTYQVSVINANGTSNTITFTVTAQGAGPPPSPKPDREQISLREGQRESSFLLEKIYPDRVIGLNFLEYPVPTDLGNPITLRIGEIVGNGCTVTLTLTRIEGNTATFIKKTDFNRPCPICLAENTLIDTPSGAIPVQQLQNGMAIWTINGFGDRVSAVIVETSKTPVPANHQIIHLTLDDGRDIFASPGHPIGDGRAIGNLSLGDLLDGGRVITAERVPYQKGYTYDVLPSGETGFYWANGILLDSTLH